MTRPGSRAGPAAGRYVTLPLPGDPRLSRGAAPAARFLGALWRDRLRHGATGRGGGLRRRLAAVAAPVVTMAARLGTTRPDTGLDRLLASVDDRWGELAARSPRLRGSPSPSSVLAVDGAMGRLVFFFAEPSHPVAVGKVPGGPSAAAVDHEVAALERVARSGRAPRALGRVGDARLQDGVPGRPLGLPRGRRSDAPSPALLRALDGLVEVSRTTARAGAPAEVHDLPAALAAVPDLTSTARTRSSAALEVVARHDRSVLRHGDLSPQNVLEDGVEVVFVDWERAIPSGVAGFDALHLAVSWVEKGLGGREAGWTPRDTGRAVAHEWVTRLRAVTLPRVAAALDAVGLAAADAEAVEIAFFARRVARRTNTSAYRSGAIDVAREVLECVCGR